VAAVLDKLAEQVTALVAVRAAMALLHLLLVQVLHAAVAAAVQFKVHQARAQADQAVAVLVL
jgi:hypothetical protein